MPSKASVIVHHRLPGRVRLRLSLDILNLQRLRDSIIEHEGMESLQYTAVTRSLLLRFDPEKVSLEEILIRVALCLSLDHERRNVRILTTPAREEISDAPWYSAFLIITALAARLLSKDNTSTPMSFIASIATAAAVVEHGIKEIEERGNFDPEVLSVFYLITSMLRGNDLPAAMFTWASTFGRHLLAAPKRGVEIRPVELDDGATFEVVVSPDTTPPSKSDILALLPSLFKYLVSGGKKRALLEELQEASRVHGEVLEGLGSFGNGIAIKFR